MPIVGSLYFIKEGFEFEGMKPVQIGLIGMGSAQLAFEGVQLARIMQNPHRWREFGLFMARPIIIAKELVTGTAQVASLARMTIQNYGKNPALMAQSVRMNG